MPSSKVTVQVDTSRDPVAPWWHTLLVLMPLAIGSVAGWYQHGLPNAHVPGISSRLSSYITVLVQEWGVVLLIWFALKRRGLSIGSLISGHWQTLGSFFKDLGLAVEFFVVAVPLLGVLVHFIGGDATSNVTHITPKTAFELAMWLGLAATAGFVKNLFSVDIWTDNSTRGRVALYWLSFFKGHYLVSPTGITRKSWR